MSAAVVGSVTDDVTEPTPLFKKQILIKRGGSYREATLGTGDIPVTDEDWLKFLWNAMDVEEAALGPVAATTNTDTKTRDSLTVLQETRRTLVTGAPFPKLLRTPVTAFIYYRWSADGVPVYSGHILMQPYLVPHILFFVSIYKSRAERERGLSGRILDDVETYATERGDRQIITVPLAVMVPILVARGFVELPNPDGDTMFYKILPADTKTSKMSGGGVERRHVRSNRNRTNKTTRWKQGRRSTATNRRRSDKAFR